MKKEEILQFNKLCAKFLNYVYVSSLDVKEGKYHPSIIAGWYKKVPGIYLPRINSHLYIGRSHFDLKFDSDWNLIMEIKNAIENYRPEGIITPVYWLKMEDKRCTIKIHPQYCMGFPEDIPEFEDYYEGNNLKEAVITAINEFLIWYNEQTN